MDRAGVAQLVEHLICNQRVGGSNPFASSTLGKLKTGPGTAESFTGIDLLGAGPVLRSDSNSGASSWLPEFLRMEFDALKWPFCGVWLG